MHTPSSLNEILVLLQKEQVQVLINRNIVPLSNLFTTNIPIHSQQSKTQAHKSQHTKVLPLFIEFSSILRYNKHTTKNNKGQLRKQMDIEKFTKIADEESLKMPNEFYKGLNGGIIIEDRTYLSENAIDNDLYVLGMYKSGPLGHQIILYYGSFIKMFPYLTDEQMRKKINHTIKHEFRHHLENMAGIHGKNSLEEEDRQQYYEYVLAHQKSTK